MNYKSSDFISLTKAIGFYDELRRRKFDNEITIFNSPVDPNPYNNITGYNITVSNPNYLHETQDFLIYIRNGKINLYGKDLEQKELKLIKIAPSFCKKILIYPTEDILNGLNYLEHIMNNFHEMLYKIVNTYNYLTVYNPSTNYDALLDIKTGKYKYTDLSINNREFSDLYNTCKGSDF